MRALVVDVCILKHLLCHWLMSAAMEEKLPSVEVRLKRLKSTEGFSTCCAIAQRLILTAVDFNRNSG
jgi:hypothetical protein